MARSPQEEKGRRADDVRSSPAPAARTVGGRYRLEGVLGRGGMGVVWAGVDEVLGRPVAVKEVVPPATVDDADRDEVRVRTLREAQAAARISAEGVVAIYDVVEDDGRPWIVMERLPARTLEDELTERGGLPPEEVAQIGSTLLAGLVAAHAAGVLHRDVKPGNVMFRDRPDGRRAVLADFGIAHLDGDAMLTATGQMMGSPAYIAPERARGGSATPASDLWSLGVTLWAAVEGWSPFRRVNGLASLTAVITEEVPRAERAGPLLPLLDGLLRKDPAERVDAATAQRLLEEALPPAGPPTTHLGVATTAPLPSPVPADAAQDDVPQPTQVLPAAADGADVVATPDVPPDGSAPPDAPAPDAAARPGDTRSGDFPGAVDDGSPATHASPSARSAPPTLAPGSAPPSWAPAAPADEPPRRRRRRLAPALLALAVVAIVAVGAALVQTFGGDAPDDAAPQATAPAAGSPEDAAEPTDPDPADEGEDQGAGQGAEGAAPAQDDAADADAAEQQEQPDGGQPAAGDDGGGGTAPEGTDVPDGFERHVDETGFSVAVPAGWRAERQGPRVYLRDPGSRAYLLVDQTDQPAADPVADWEQQEPSVAGRLQSYERIGEIRAVDYRGWPAADWEFVFGPGQNTHVLNRNVVTGPGRAYALYWSVPSSQWDAMLPVHEQVLASFQPAP